MAVKEEMTKGDVIKLVELALTLEGEEQAALVQWLLALGPYAKENIGYMSGYFERSKAVAIMELFGTEHPFFGKGQPTSEEAFATGYKLGSLLRG